MILTVVLGLWSATVFGQCTTAAATYTDLNGAGGAPCFDGTSCAVTDPDFTGIGIGIFGSEAYLLDGVQAGFDYVFDMCSGFGAGAWIPAISIVTPTNQVDAFSLGTTGTFQDNCSLAWTATESGTYRIIIHRAGDACGTAFNVDNGNPTVTCGANPAICADCSVGEFDVSQSPVSLCPGEEFVVSTDGTESTPGGFGIAFNNLPTASGGPFADDPNGDFGFVLTGVSGFPTAVDSELGGLLSGAGVLEGPWSLFLFAYGDAADLAGTICSSSFPDSLIINFLTSSDPACAQSCEADAGTVTADQESPVCFENGAAAISVTANGDATVPAGYTLTYGLVDANGVILALDANGQFTVDAEGTYTIHPFVYDPAELTLAPPVFNPGVTTVAQVLQAIDFTGACADLDLVGATFVVEVCEVPCEAFAGALTAVDSEVCLFDGEDALIAAVADGNAVVPAGYEIIYVLTEGDDLVIVNVNATPDFAVTTVGDYTIHTLVYDPTTLDLGIVELGVTTGVDVNDLLIQGGGSICGSLDVAGAPIAVVACEPCDAVAGGLTAVDDAVCLVNGDAFISATPDGNAVVPTGYETIYVLTEGDGLVIINVNADPEFTVSAGGDYTIHTLVYNPATLDLSIVDLGVTTGFDVNNLLQQGGGNICAALDVAGAPVTVNAPDAGTITANNPQTCLSDGLATINATPGNDAVVPDGYEVIYVLTMGPQLVIMDAQPNPSFTVDAEGNYTVHTLVYNPDELDLSIIDFGTTTGVDVLGIITASGGDICASLDVPGAPVEVVTCAPCDAAAGALAPDADDVCLEDGTADISATADGSAVVPAGFETIYVLTEGDGLVIVQVNATPEFTVTAEGDYTIHTLVYDPTTLDLSIVQLGVTTGFDVNSLLQQGGGIICGALDVAGASFSIETCFTCEVSAGTLSGSQSDICLFNNVTITATPNGDAVVPAGYETIYVLTQGSGLVILNVSAQPTFVITDLGDFTIHTLVYDPNTLDLGIVQFGTTTGFDVNSLLIQGGGSICAALDVAGATFSTIDCPQPCAEVSAGSLITSSELVCLFDGSAVLAATNTVDPSFPIGYEVLYVLTEGTGLVIVDAGNFPVFTVTEGGDYTIHTLVYDPNTLDVSTVVFGTTTGFDVNGLLEQGGGSACGALDVAGVSITVPDLESTIGELSVDGDVVSLVNVSGNTGFQWFFNGNPIPEATGTSYEVAESGNYSVQYTGENGCPQTSEIVAVTYSGGNISVEEQDVFRSLSMFPNPNSGQFTVRGELVNAMDVSILVMDLTGRQVMSAIVLNGAHVFTQDVDVSAVSQGMYLLRIQSEAGEKTVRFIKN